MALLRLSLLCLFTLRLSAAESYDVVVYGGTAAGVIAAVLAGRLQHTPFNLLATLLFAGAVLHTFFTHKFREMAHRLQHRAGGQEPTPAALALSRLLHFLGEVEAVFGIWAVPLLILMAVRIGGAQTLNYLNHRVSFIEPVFVVAIMAVASTRPVLQFAEGFLSFFARLGGGGAKAWWFAILLIGPLLGSLITEPAAMTIAALLLSRQFYRRRPGPRLAYATLGLLFVNISVGGLLTHFAAPPVLMVAAPWQWNSRFMFTSFGLPAVTGILIATTLCGLVLRRDFATLALLPAGTGERNDGEDETTPARTPIPAWIIAGHLLFLAWMVLCCHYPVMIIGGVLFFLAFHEITREFQHPLNLRAPILVGFFLAGLVVHGGLQQWWIEPVLGRLGELPLLFGALGLTAFNDNAAVTYLATLVPSLTDGMKYAVVAGAMAGGGLTVIANAPNPAGQSILDRHFQGGIAPLKLFLGALFPTVVVTLCLLAGWFLARNPG